MTKNRKASLKNSLNFALSVESGFACFSTCVSVQIFEMKGTNQKQRIAKKHRFSVKFAVFNYL
jgi:hypothetical protein